MDVINKIAALSKEADYEVGEDDVKKAWSGGMTDLQPRWNMGNVANSAQKVKRGLDPSQMPIYQASAGGGVKVPLLKILLTSVCKNNCNYCGCRLGRDFERFVFQPDELARAFMMLFEKGSVKGLFLSSAVVRNGVYTQDRLIATAEVLRKKMGYKGYLHLKIMPGAERDQIYAAMQLADRVSLNLESPDPECLKDLAPKKEFSSELLLRLKWINEIRNNFHKSHGWKGHWPSSTTQFVVGAVEDTDKRLLKTAAYLHQKLQLRRIYYARFNPVNGTPLEGKTAENPTRILRLYQADFLLRDYGFTLNDLNFEKDHALALDVDPKLAWAKANLSHDPIELNQAERSLLMRLPGIGPKKAKKIIDERKRSKILSLKDLNKIGINAERCAPYVLINGRQPDYQLKLW